MADGRGLTPVALTTITGDTQMANLLISYGASPMDLNQYAQLARAHMSGGPFARYSDWINILSALLEREDYDSRD